MFIGYQEGVSNVFAMCLDGFLRVSEGCLEGFYKAVNQNEKVKFFGPKVFMTSKSKILLTSNIFATELFMDPKFLLTPN